MLYKDSFEIPLKVMIGINMSGKKREQYENLDNVNCKHQPITDDSPFLNLLKKQNSKDRFIP